jgi:hypothetical protein
MKTKILFSFLISVILAYFFGAIAAPVLEVSHAVASLGAMALIIVTSAVAPDGVALMAVQKEIWVKFIIERLWKKNLFLANAFNEDEYVLSGKVVHIPNPGSKPSVIKNRSSYPGTVVRRTDTDITYNLDEYTTDPTHIVDADKYELSYDKIASVFGDHAGILAETIGDDMLIKWLTGGTNKLYTSGASRAAVFAGQTGNRKAFIHDDLRKAQLLFDTQNVSDDDRFALIEANMYDDLVQSLSNTQYRDFSSALDASKGIVGKLYGFQIMKRSSVAISAVTTDAINPLGATVQTTDNVVSLCWQKDSVTRAIGETKFFENPDRAEYYGDIYSALVRMGGRRRRADDAGVCAIIQAA